MGFLWTQKRVKTLGFLRFLNMQLFGSLKLLMAPWAHLCPFLQKLPPTFGPESVQNWTITFFKIDLDNFAKKHKKKDNLGFFFGAFLGTILGPILGPDRPKRGQDEPKRAIRSFKKAKNCMFKNLKKPSVF